MANDEEYNMLSNEEFVMRMMDEGMSRQDAENYVMITRLNEPQSQEEYDEMMAFNH